MLNSSKQRWKDDGFHIEVQKTHHKKWVFFGSKEKMEQVQAIAAERDEARSEATRLREGGGIEDLQEKQQAIAAIIRSEMQSWEEPARRATHKKTGARIFWKRMYFPMPDFFWLDLFFFLWKEAQIVRQVFFWVFAKGQAEKSR